VQRTRNSMLCPNCRRLISRDEAVCPYCQTGRPGSWWKGGLLGASFGWGRSVEYIIYANVAMYLLALLISPRQVGLTSSPFDLLAPGISALQRLGATGTVAILRQHHWWTLLAANYLHGSLLHILFNMLALRQLGPLVVREYGASRMVVIYTLAGVLGFVVSVLAGVRFTIGASAAVCGLMGAILYYGKSRGGAYGQAIYSQVGAWAVGILVFGFMFPGINNWGHGGGMAAGVVLGYLLGYQERYREGLGHRGLAFACAVITVLVLAWATLNGLFFVLVR